MTRKEFEENKEPLVFIVSLDPATGKVLYDTYAYDSYFSFQHISLLKCRLSQEGRS